MEDKNNDVKSDFFESLENAYDSLPENTVKIIVGYLNAQIGRESSHRPTIGQERPCGKQYVFPKKIYLQTNMDISQHINKKPN